MQMGIAYLGYLNGTPIPSGSIIPMNTIIARECINADTGGVVKGKGYYLVNVTATLTSTAGGSATITLLQNGSAVLGANATETISAGGTSTITFSAVIKNSCCNPTSTLSLLYSGAVVTATKATMVIADA
jgi:hypothetical protein